MSGCLEATRRLSDAVESRGLQRDKNVRQDMPPVEKKPFGGLPGMKEFVLHIIITLRGML